MKVGVLALQGDVREHAGVLSDLGADPIEVRSPQELAGIDALILPGGESTTMSMLLESSGLFAPIADRLAEGMPAFGTCAGMILLATEVLDGRRDQRCFGAIDLSVRRNAFGRQVESFESDLEVSKMTGGPMRAVFIRAPVVERTGPGVEVLASVARPVGEAGPGGRSVGEAGPETQPVVCRHGSVLVAAFHPELAGDWRLHELFLSSVGSTTGRQVQ
ncbi:MAG TPA: pyridoxal 5'-phosphate synthase glutaminase subunit PdxT [Acidimicrobiales bacterium]|nr:pyridoxal 5'-phosphate synthase glutaminase subunit PdxT [Acidimicrobiales bacterium]